MSSLTQAWRALVRRRTFTLTTVLTLAVGIGLTTATYSIVNGVLLRSLPFPDAVQLVAVSEASPGRRERASLVAPARLIDWDRRNRTFAALSGSYAESVTDTSGAEPERLEGRRVLPRYFDVFGMAPLAGRTFDADEERFGGSHAVVIGEAFWARRFGRSPAAIGSRLIIGGTAFTIVGVMPASFTTAATDVWVPAQLSPDLMLVREARFVSGVGRINSGITLEAARQDLARVQAALGVEYPRTDKDWSVDVRALKDVRVGEYRRPLFLVFAAVGLLFAIAVANVAGLVLVQLHRRAAEFAIRAAIGASRLQVIGAVMREIGILAVAGATGGAMLAWLLTRLSVVAFASIPRMADVTLDLRALAFVAGASVVAAAAFGLLPAIAATRTRVSDLLAGAGRGASSGRHRLQSAIVIAQLALGVVLAGSAGLLLRSYSALADADSGFRADGVLTFHVGAAWDEDRTRVAQIQERLLEELHRVPGVRAAGYANFLPASRGTLRSQVTVPGLSGTEAAGVLTVGQRTVTAGYMQALSIPLLAGEWCPDLRAGGAGPARVMVNRQFVDRFAAGQNIVGRNLQFTQFRSAPLLIAGVVGDVLEDGPATPAVPYVYTCLRLGSWPDPEYVVRADGDPRQLVAAIRSIVKSIDPMRPVFGVKALADVGDAALDQPRLNARLIGGFAAAALVLAALGLYGLLTLLVTQRRRELGVRTALGASPLDLVEFVVAGAGRLVATGIGAGVMLLLGAGNLMRASLFGVTPYDPRALAWSVGALTLAALVAVIVPARQAARVNAIEAIKNA
jgi:predicted permease